MYANPGDSFPLSPVKTYVSTWRLDGNRLIYNSHSIVPESTDQDGNIIPEHESISSEEFIKLVE